ncbi:MAG: efflux RND transporter permease subunit, partial [Holophagales bacterium]|nr:efflux RND transporter permease subunit [Holophagales bacterium]
VASTATTLCVFVPVIFLRGSGGFFSRYLTEVGTTICIVMVASLLVALTVVPMVASLLLSHERPKHLGFLVALETAYTRVLGLTLRFRLLFLVLAAGMLWGSWHLFGTIERSFGGRAQERQVTIEVDTPRNFGLEETRAVFDDVRQILMANAEELDIADITSSFRVGGGRSRGGFRGGRRFELYLKDESESRLTTGQVRDRVRELLPVKAGVELKIAQARSRFGGGGLGLELSGDDPAVLELLARQVGAEVAVIPGVQDVDISLESGDPELRLAVDRAKALRAGLSSQAVAATVQNALSDRSLSYLSSDDREVDLVMLFREEQEATLGQLRGVEVRVEGEAGEAAVPLETLVSFEAVPGPQAIERQNRRAKIRLTANSDDPRAIGMAMRSVGAIMSSMPLPAGYEWSFGRRDRMRQRDQEGSSFALLFALVLVYMLMSALFESFSHPFAIMMAVPFAFIGVGVVMKLASQPRDNFTELGFIVLVGVVVNNAIVLVDHINRLRQEGWRRGEAILRGGRDRLRPILMTAVTTIVGLLPMVAPVILPQYFGPIEGRAATWAPVGLVILGGLTTSTFLTLLIVPTFYSVVDDVARFGRRVMARVVA